MSKHALKDRKNFAANGSVAFRSYSDFARLLIRTAVALNTSLARARTLGLHDDALRLERTLQHLEDGAFSIAVVGEFKRGKSTVINALLGSSALPTDAMPATASITRVIYGREAQATLRLRDGRHETVPIRELNRHITKLDDAAAKRAAEVEEAIVSYPTLFCQNNVEIIDTPGLSDEAAMTRLTLDVIPRADAAIFVISALSPFGQTEASFLKQLMTTIDAGRVFFVVTHIDKLNRPADVERLTAAVRQRVGAAIQTARPREVPRAPLRLFPVSAWQALEGKVQRDSALSAASRFPDLERALEEYLARDRGAAALTQVMQVIRETSATRLDELQKRLKIVKQAENSQVQRHQEQLMELDAITAAMARHQTELDARAKAWQDQIRQAVVHKLQYLQYATQAALGHMKLPDQLLSDNEARQRTVRRLLLQTTLPIVADLSRTLVATIVEAARAEDAALLAISQRLDRALANPGAVADSPPSLRTSAAADGQICTALALAGPILPALERIATDFEGAFQPEASVITEQTLGIAGRVLGSESVQEGYRTIRGWFQSDGASRAEAQMVETRDQIRERLRRAYITKTAQHVESLFSTLAIESKGIAAADALAEGLGALLAREQEHVSKIAEWRRVDLKIERARRHEMNTHEQEDLQEMQQETLDVAAEADNHTEVLAIALGIGGRDHEVAAS